MDNLATAQLSRVHHFAETTSERELSGKVDYRVVPIPKLRRNPRPGTRRKTATDKAWVLRPTLTADTVMYPTSPGSFSPPRHARSKRVQVVCILEVKGCPPLALALCRLHRHGRRFACSSDISFGSRSGLELVFGEYVRARRCAAPRRRRYRPFSRKSLQNQAF